MQIRLGTRKSPLALVQAHQVRDRLAVARPGLEIEIMPMTTSGDKSHGPLADIGGKALFTKELEEALLEKRIDIAVHSMKDVEAALPAGLVIGCMLLREDVRDMLIGGGLASVDDLPQGAVIGTSSPRRAAQMLMRRPDLRIVPLRGNVETRLDKIARGEADATLLAMAGLNRLGMFPLPLWEGAGGGGTLHGESPPSLTPPHKGGGNICGVILSAEEFIPAVGQGAVGVECREGDAEIRECLAALSHADTETAVSCERAFLLALGGSCRTPIAGHAEVKGDVLRFHGLIARPDGSASYRIEREGRAVEAETIGAHAGAALLAEAGPGFI